MQPMLATRGDHVPNGPEWSHEVKWDGIRALVEVAGGPGAGCGRATRTTSPSPGPSSRRSAGLGPRRPPRRRDRRPRRRSDLVRGPRRPDAPARPAPDRPAGGRPTRSRCSPSTCSASTARTSPGGRSRERRGAARGLGLDAPAWRRRLQVPATYDDGRGAAARPPSSSGLEGIVSKRWSSRYHPGRRSRDWLKFPIRPTGSFVVGGYRHETDSDHRLGARAGRRADRGRGWSFRGRVGSGIAGRAGQRLGELLRPLVRDTSPFAHRRCRRSTPLGTVWVEPEVVVDVQYLVITRDGRLRQPAYRGVRTDLDAIGPDRRGGRVTTGPRTARGRCCSCWRRVGSAPAGRRRAAARRAPRPRSRRARRSPGHPRRRPGRGCRPAAAGGHRQPHPRLPRPGLALAARRRPAGSWWPARSDGRIGYGGLVRRGSRAAGQRHDAARHLPAAVVVRHAPAGPRLGPELPPDPGAATTGSRTTSRRTTTATATRPRAASAGGCR